MHHRTALASPTFRTNAAGDIALRPEWPALLTTLRDAGPWLVQTRHPYARLITNGELPNWAFADTNSCAHDPVGALHFHFAHWDHAVARLEFCPCCASPGYIEIRNTAGRPFLQFRSPAEHSLDELAAITAGLAEFGSVPPSAEPRGPVLFPCIDDLDCSRTPAAFLPELLARFGDAGLPLLWRIRTSESDHRRAFVPAGIRVESGLLTVSGPDRSTCQLILPAAAHLVLETASDRQLIHVVTTDDSLLLTLTASPGHEHHPAWTATLAATFTHSAQP